MKLRANLVKEGLKQDPTTKGWSLSLQMKQIPTVENLQEFLGKNQELLHLDLSYNYLSRIEYGISSFKKLKWLDLSANHISFIENLEGLDELEYLNLSTNRIKTIENLNCLSALNILVKLLP